MSFVLGSTLLLGSTCTPTPQGCDFAGRCDPTDFTTAEACINFCVPLFEGDVLDDVMCPLDDCDRAAYLRPDVFRCPSPTAAGQSYACVPSDRSPEPGRIGFCRAAAGLFDECDPDRATGGDPRPCESGTFCVDVADAAACARAFPLRRRAGLSGSARGFCWLPAREGEACDSNLDRGPHGCAPCESGTWCRVTPDHGRVCLRACELPEAPGVERSDLCACTGVDEPCVVLPAPTDQPQRYCRPLLVPNGNLCNPQGGVPCADPGADCQLTSDPHRGEVFTCCRYPGDTCRSDADCCDGYAVCSGGRCTACGREGQPATSVGCCPGHVVVDEASGEQACRSCAVSREGRARAPFEGARCGGEFVQLEAEGGARDTIAVPEGGNTGAGPAELARTSGRAERVRYRLGERHRLFLLQGDLTGRWDDRDPPADPPDFLPSATAGWPPAGVTVGHRFAQLPANFPGQPVRTIELSALPGGDPTSTWQSLRVYDAGLCSRFISYQIAVDGLVAALNQYLNDRHFEVTPGVFYGFEPLTLAPERPDYAVLPHFTPILSSGSGDFGRAIDSDQLNAFVEYAALGGAAFGCFDGRLRLSAGLRLRRRAAVASTLESELEDRRRTVAHDCDEGPPGCREVCHFEGDRYLCLQSGGPVPLPPRFVSRPRRVQVLRDAFDFEPVIEFFDGGLVDCSVSGLNDAITGNIEGRIRSQLDGILSLLAGSLTRAVTEWPVVEADGSLRPRRFSDLAPCARTDPETGAVFASDAMCAAADPPFFGGRRQSCVGIQESGEWTDDPGLAVDYRCGRVRFELRRINLRPDGLEAVLADSEDDPQYPLFITHRPASGVPLGEAYCLENRPGSRRDEDPALVDTVTRGESLIARGQDRRICHPDDALAVGEDGALHGCQGICGDLGVQCGGPHAGTVREEGPLRSRERCYVQPLDALAPGQTERGAAQCCLPADFCPVPPAGGGRPFFESAPSPPAAPSTTWACVNRLDNRWACGGCGNVCADGEACCGGECAALASSSAHCGTCGNACPGSAPCLGGRCCAEGEVLCPSGDRFVCTDVSTNPFACGSCGTRCRTGHCAGGLCCLPGEVSCDGACADLQSDALHCGGCGAACPAGTACCGGACVDTSSSGLHCGRCRNRCPPLQRCEGGTCVR
ncbi:MAG: hypothetical protein KF729_04770 [Sandaracinaceae bacterium]|nr:hypothetical protein [Sandaracinaceae bacterium]